MQRIATYCVELQTMCIVLWTTACADQGFPLILLSNRDEFLHRPTQPAGPWESSDEGVYGGRDLARPENGTWLGITRSGRFAALTNVREANSVAAVSSVSRGAVVSSFLASPEADFESSWMDRLETIHKHGEEHPHSGLDLDQVGGFSMLCGQFVRTAEQRFGSEPWGSSPTGQGPDKSMRILWIPWTQSSANHTA